MLAAASVSLFMICPEDAKKLLKSQCPTDDTRYSQHMNLLQPLELSTLKEFFLFWLNKDFLTCLRIFGLGHTAVNVL